MKPPADQWPDFIRDNLGMYIGGNMDDALYRLVKTMLKEAMQDAARPARRFEITLHADDSFSLSSDADWSGLDIADLPTMTQRGQRMLDAPSRSSWSYMLAACGLSAWFRRTLATGRTVYREDTVATTATSTWTTEDDDRPAGQTISFLPDPALFIRGSMPWHAFWKDLRELAALSTGRTIRLINEQIGVETTFSYRHGLKSYLAELIPLHEREPLHIRAAVGECEVEAALHWPAFDSPGWRRPAPFLRSFVNGERTRSGSHVDGFWRGLIEGLAAFIEHTGLGDPRDFTLRRTRIKPYLCGAIAVNLPKAAWAGATKAELANPEVEPLVAGLIREAVLAAANAEPPGQKADPTSLAAQLKHPLR
ncbi:MAG TPA: hypothetical protein VD886_25380 [Herpetosiphonaceae bacterium]|nr:hypothetical protein [Herpetosiphonaceae bacterium]